MNYIHNPRSGKFEPKRSNPNHVYKIHWSTGLILIAGVVLIAVAMRYHNASASQESLEIPIAQLQKAMTIQPSTNTVLSPEERAQVQKKQELILQEAEALKQKKMLESELAEVEAKLSAIRKQSISFQSAH
mgnify:FL=1|jgi:hypothetical protein